MNFITEVSPIVQCCSPTMPRTYCGVCPYSHRTSPYFNAVVYGWMMFIVFSPYKLPAFILGGAVVLFMIVQAPLVVLLGQEAKSPGWSESEKWSDFGGVPKPGEPDEEAAAREWYEETMGIYGCVDTYRVMVRKYKFKVVVGTAVIFLVPRPYDTRVNTVHNNIHQYLTKCMRPHPMWPEARHIPSCPEGYGEKTCLQWHSCDEIKSHPALYRSAFHNAFQSPSFQAALRAVR